METIVKIEDGVAHFEIYHETHGIYRAELIRFDGPPDQAPPSQLLLTRSFRSWIGSSDRQDLLQELGQQIDEVAANAPLFQQEPRLERNRDKSNSPEQKKRHGSAGV